MDSITNKTRLAEKRYRDKLKKSKKEIRLNNNQHKKQNKKIRKHEEDYKNYNHQLQKTKKLTKLQKKKEYELNKRKKLIRIQNESNKETKQNERRQKIENIVEDVDLGRFFELATSNKIYVNNLNLHEIKNEILQDYTGDFELTGKKIIGPTEHKTNIRFKNMDDFENYINAIDVDYDSEDVTFTGYVYKLNTPHFNLLNEVLMVKVLIICKKLLNITEETVTYQLLECVLSNVSIILLKKITHKNF